MTTVSEIIKGSTYSTFQYYRDGSLWYQTSPDLMVAHTGETIGEAFLFPVPINDIGTATFNNMEKTILLMRYIRKWYDKVQAERVKCNDDPHSPG